VNKSRICKEAEAGKNIIDQTYCCPKDKDCSSYLRDDCLSGSEITRCHNVTLFEACKRNDSSIVQVCGGLQNGLFCLSAEVSRKDPTYTRFPEALEWMIDRHTVSDSGNVTVCDDGVHYQLCDAN
jgi:hypothetical protein